MLILYFGITHIIYWPYSGQSNHAARTINPMVSERPSPRLIIICPPCRPLDRLLVQLLCALDGHVEFMPMVIANAITPAVAAATRPTDYLLIRFFLLAHTSSYAASGGVLRHVGRCWSCDFATYVRCLLLPRQRYTTCVPVSAHLYVRDAH